MSTFPLIRKDSPFYQALPRLKPASVKVYVVLAQHANRKTGECFPKVASIAEAAGLSDRAVKTAIADLTDEGLVTTKRRKRFNVYTLVRSEADFTSQPSQEVKHASHHKQSRSEADGARSEARFPGKVKHASHHIENPPSNPPAGTLHVASLRDAEADREKIIRAFLKWNRWDDEARDVGEDFADKALATGASVQAIKAVGKELADRVGVVHLRPAIARIEAAAAGGAA